MNMENQTNDGKILTIIREFDASQKEVFNAFAEIEALNEWWGPAETENSAISLDFRPGGIFHFKMEAGGRVNYGRFLFSKIQPYDLLEFTNAFADENANAIRAPFDIPLPIEIFYSFRFSENDGKTTLTMTGQPVNGTSEEEDTFVAINDSMQQGFGGTFDALARYLGRIKID